MMGLCLWVSSNARAVHGAGEQRRFATRRYMAGINGKGLKSLECRHLASRVFLREIDRLTRRCE
ncbi:hypothetical protein JCM10599A_38840 [Paraburkholderia kururiensis]